jgi:hypothetical protein
MAISTALVWQAVTNPAALREAADVAAEIRTRLDEAGAVVVKARADLAELAPEVAGQMTGTLRQAAEVAVRVSTIGERTRRLAG